MHGVRAARLHAVGDLRVAEEPEPTGGEPGMSLVRVTAVGICGSDLHWWDEGAIGDAKLTHPLVLGHEGAGVIADVPGLPGRVPEPVPPDQVLRPRRDRRHAARGHGLAFRVAAPAAGPGVRRG